MSITFGQIANANATIKTTDIKGKDYAEVNQRIKAFRMVHPNGAITTEIIELENGIVTMKASVYDDELRLIGTGTAQEKESSTFINKTSFIENCETSAVGRALGMCGFGIDTSVASFEEVTNAMNNQEKEDEKPRKPEPPKEISPRQKLSVLLKEKGYGAVEYAKEKGIDKSTPVERINELIKELEGNN